MLGRLLRAVQPHQVGLVLAEQQLGRGAVRTRVDLPPQRTEPRMAHVNGLRPRSAQRRTRRALRPGPRVAEPQVRQHVKRRLVRPGIGNADLHEEVMRIGLGVDHLDHPIPVVVEHAGVQELVLGLALVTPAVLGHQIPIGELGLRVVVAPPQPRVARQRVEVPPVLLHVLAVVALRAGQTEHPLLQDRIPAVPQCQGHAQFLAHVGDAGHAVLTPAVRAGTGMVVREVIPRRPGGAVVLPHRPPRPFGQVRAPQVPRRRFVQAVLGMAEGLHPLPFRARHQSLLVSSRRFKRACGQPGRQRPGSTRRPAPDPDCCRGRRQPRARSAR